MFAITHVVSSDFLVARERGILKVCAYACLNFEFAEQLPAVCKVYGVIHGSGN